MNTQKTNTRTVYAGEGIIKLIIPEHTAHVVMVRVKTIHDECQGLFNEDQQEVDPDLLCHDQDEYIILNLATITVDDLEEEVDRVIEKGGFHGLEHDDDVFYSYISFEYVFYDQDRMSLSLFGMAEQELRRVLGGGEGFVEVVWDF